MGTYSYASPISELQILNYKNAVYSQYLPCSHLRFITNLTFSQLSDG